MKQFPNPICKDVVKNIRDPFILKDNGKYYLTGTTPPFWNGVNDGVMLWESKDLVNWEEIGYILPSGIAKQDDWFRDYWWAPEIQKINGKYYITVNCRNEDIGVGQNPLIAVADEIYGNYRLLNADEPFFTAEKQAKGLCIGDHGNDANLFVDDDGKTYISTCCYEGIHICEIDLEKGKLIGDEILMVAQEKDGWDTKNEAPFVMKRNGTYYCFYSSFTRSYEVGVAYAKDIKGPWIKDDRNPIITPENVDGLIHSGHNCVFRDNLGRYLTSYHITLDSNHDQHLLAIDEIKFDKNDKVITNAPTLSDKMPRPKPTGLALAFFILSIIFNILTIVCFVTSLNSLGIVYLCIASCFLCLGTAKQNKQSSKKKE